jgi:hypothetical protein
LFLVTLTVRLSRRVAITGLLVFLLLTFSTYCLGDLFKECHLTKTTNLGLVCWKMRLILLACKVPSMANLPLQAFILPQWMSHPLKVFNLKTIELSIVRTLTSIHKLIFNRLDLGLGQVAAANKRCPSESKEACSLHHILAYAIRAVIRPDIELSSMPDLLDLITQLEMLRRQALVTLNNALRVDQQGSHGDQTRRLSKSKKASLQALGLRDSAIRAAYFRLILAFCQLVGSTLNVLIEEAKVHIPACLQAMDFGNTTTYTSIYAYLLPSFGALKLSCIYYSAFRYHVFPFRTPTISSLD